MGVTWYSSPLILEMACSARLTYRPTLVPVPIGWMLNSAMETIRLFFRTRTFEMRSCSVLLILALAALADQPILPVRRFLAQTVRLLVLLGLVNV